MLKAHTPGIATMEFHIARDARDRYRFDDSLYSITGNVILANFHAARVFAQRMNQKRDLVNYPEQSVKASQINAMGLIHELTHYMFRAYREQNNPQLLTQTLGWLNEKLGTDAVDAALTAGDTSGARFEEYGEHLCLGIENMRKLVYAFYDQNFSFGRMLKAYPEQRGRLTDSLIGDLFSADFVELHAAMSEFAELPPELPHGRAPAGIAA